MSDKAKLLTAREAADFLRVHVITIRRMARRNDLPTYRVGQQWRFPEDGLIDWAKTHHIRQRSQLVLVVDDEKAIRETVQMFLESENFRVSTAENGKDALDLTRRETPNLVLLDLSMPDMSGVAVLKERHRMDPDLPVVIVTAYPDSDMMHQAMQFPPVMLLPKPVTKAALMRTVHRLLDGSGGRKP